MLKKLISCAAALVMAFGAAAELPESVLLNKSSMTAKAAVNAEVVYDLNTLPTFSRTKEEIGKKYSDAINSGSAYKSGDSSTYYTVPASTKSPYNEGVLKQDTVTVMQELTNFYRYLVGVQPLINKCVPSPYLQYQALDRSFVYSHYVSDSDKPDDMSKELWDKGSMLNHNILAWGYTPSGAITGWMNEGYDIESGAWDTFGHRYALINENLSEIQFGYCGSTGIGHDIEYANGSMKEIAYAFPAPGYMPNSLVHPYECGWNVDYDYNIIYADNNNNVTVTITNLRTKKTFKRTAEDNTLRVYYSSLCFAQPDDYNTSYRYTDNYKVEITGLKDKNGKSAAIVYEVDFFDIRDYQDSYVVSAVPEQYDHLVIYSSLNDTASLKKIASILPSEVSVTAESGKICKIPVSTKWTLDEKNHCFRAKADASKLPKILTDKNNILSDIKVSYTISDDYFDQFNSLDIYPSEITEGESTQFEVYRTNVSYDRTSVYKITANNDGTYSSVKRFDDLSSSEFDKQGSGTSHFYNLKNAKISDSGEYISIYFSSADYWNEAYVSTSVQMLKVSHNYKVTTVPATCTADGKKTYTCTVCGDSYSQVLPKTGHKYVSKVTKPTYDSQGYTTHTCSVCGDSYKDSYTDKLTRKSISGAAVSGISNRHYTGKAITQKITVKLGSKTLKAGTDYTVTYKNNKAVGKATIVITGKGGYKGTITKTFKVCPPKTTLKSVTSPKTKQLKAAFSKVSGVTGYQVTYSTSSKFTKAATKSVNVKGTSKTISKLTKSKTYYVKVRSYKTVNGVKYYSAYSAVKKVKVK